MICAATAASAAESLRVLMIGNSYTLSGGATEQVATQLQNFFNADSRYAAQVVARAPGGYQLYNHYTDSTTSNMLVNQGPWDFVVLQEQSYTASHGWLYGGAWWNTFDYGIGELTGLARAQGARVVYFQTWARATNETGVLQIDYDGDPRFMQDCLTAAYSIEGHYWAAKVAPVGEAWWTSLRVSPALTLHQGDLSHMNARGAYLAAAALYEVMSGRDSRSLGYASTLPASEATQLLANLHALLPQPNLDLDPVIPTGQVFHVAASAASGTVVGTLAAFPYSPPPTEQVRDRSPRIVAWSWFTNPVPGLAWGTGGTLRVQSALPPSGRFQGIAQVRDSNDWVARAPVGIVVQRSNFGSWITNFTGLTATGPADDPDDDRLPNLLEYAWGGDPAQADLAAGIPRPVLGEDGRWGLIYRRRVDPELVGLRYDVSFAAHIEAAWSAGWPASETVEALTGNWERVTVLLSNTAAQAFGRVSVRTFP
jgi:hypothetical protein